MVFSSKFNVFFIVSMILAVVGSLSANAGQGFHISKEITDGPTFDVHGTCGRTEEHMNQWCNACDSATFTCNGPGNCDLNAGDCMVWQPAGDPRVMITTQVNAPLAAAGTLTVFTSTYGGGTHEREQVEVIVNGKYIGTTPDYVCNIGVDCFSEEECYDCSDEGPFTTSFANVAFKEGINIINLNAVENGGSVHINKLEFNGTAPDCNDAGMFSDTMPVEMKPGQKASVNITAFNTGSSNWFHGSYYKMLRRDSSGFGFVSTAPSNVVGVDYGHLPHGVDTDDSTTWTFDMTAPAQTGSYTIKWCMVHSEGIEYLNDAKQVCADAPRSTIDFACFEKQVIVKASCGDGIRDLTEGCDAGSQNGIPCVPVYGSECSYCSASCSIVTLGGGSCGDSIINGPENCEMPMTNNNLNCGQAKDDCIGYKYGSRDSYGICDDSCACVFDDFFYKCTKGKCGASCASDNDCDDSNPHTADACSQESCLCIYTTLPYCGDSHLDPGEECDAGNQNNMPCVPVYGGKCSYCDSSCKIVENAGGFCGDNVLNGNELCEMPSTGNNAHCSQSIESCQGAKLGTRDLFGDCNAACGCNKDAFSYMCVKGKCGAACAINADCSPSTCSQTYTDYCDGKKLSEYDADKIKDETTVVGSKDNTCISESCSCTSNPAACNAPPINKYCVKGVCGATCGSNVDCDDLNDKTIDSCDMSSCSCKHDLLPYCGDGLLDSGEQCDNGSANGVVCSPIYGGKCSYCDNSCKTVEKTGGSCGDNILNGAEKCELPSTTNNDFCTQAKDSCSGNKTGIRDAHGDCSSSCTCTYDIFSYSCVKGKCGGSCGNNADCDDQDPGTFDICNMNSCTCSHVAQPYCGNGLLDSGEQCDNGSANGIACIPAYGGKCSYCDSACKAINKTGGFCGDKTLNGPEKCEQPGSQNNNYCSQSNTSCSGKKYGTRDLFGNCGSTCGCVYDSFNYQCIKGKCGAACSSDSDCNDNNALTADSCSLTDCSCKHTPVGNCGDGIIQPGEQCEANGTFKGWGEYGHEFTCNQDNTYQKCVSCKYVHVDECKYYCSADAACDGKKPSTDLDQCDFGLSYRGDSCDASCHLIDKNCESGFAGCTGQKECDGLVPGTGVCNYMCEYKPLLTCGNKIVDPGEQCDGGSRNCTDLFGHPGTQECSPLCSWGECMVEQSCGDGIVNGDEECELPGTDNNHNCAQTLNSTSCQGGKLGMRDAYAYCGQICNCIEDQFSYVCVKGACGAQCSADADCNDNNNKTIDKCQGNCSCTHERIPSCGDKVLDPGEQCDDGNNKDADGCSAGCMIERKVCHDNIMLISSASLDPGCCGNGSIVTSKVLDSDNIYAVQCVCSSSIPSYLSINWNNINRTGLEGIKAFIEHKETGVSAWLEYKDSGSWEKVCDLPQRPTDMTDSCDLDIYAGLKNVSVRIGVLMDGSCQESVDYAYLSLRYCSYALPRCGDGIIDAGEQCDDANSILGDGCNNLCVKEQPIVGRSGGGGGGGSRSVSSSGNWICTNWTNCTNGTQTRNCTYGKISKNEKQNCTINATLKMVVQDAGSEGLALKAGLPDNAIGIEMAAGATGDANAAPLFLNAMMNYAFDSNDGVDEEKVIADVNENAITGFASAEQQSSGWLGSGFLFMLFLLFIMLSYFTIRK